MEGNHRVQGTDTDLMDGEAEGDTVVIAGQPEVLSTQAMQVSDVSIGHDLQCSDQLITSCFTSIISDILLFMNWIIFDHCPCLVPTGRK